MERKKIWVITGGVSILLICVVLALLIEDRTWKNSEMIAAHVYFLESDLGGLTKEEAYRVVYDLYQGQMERSLHLTGNELSWDYTAADLGLVDNSDIVVMTAYQMGRTGTIFQRYLDRISLLFNETDLDLSSLFVYDEETKEAVLAQLSEELGSTAQDACFEIDAENQVTITPSATGTALNTEKTWVALETAICDPTATEVALIIEENMEPEITTADLEAMDITTAISSFSTKYNTGQVARSHNLTLASSSLDMQIVEPGETFSFNETVGQRTAARGYQQAIIIENGEFTPGLGGGVCQVSTTLYGALIRTDLTIVERNSHSIPIAYVQSGQDAMVAWGSSDLQFKNEYDTPILIHTECSGGTITMMIFGSASYKKEVEIVSDVLRYIPFSTETRLDNSLTPGTTKVQSSGNRGLEVKVYKKIIENGEVVSTVEISHDTYRAEKRIVLQGPEVVEEDPVEETPSTETTPETTDETVDPAA